MVQRKSTDKQKKRDLTEERGNLEDYFNENGKCTFKASPQNPYPMVIVDYAKELYFDGLNYTEIEEKSGISKEVSKEWAVKYEWKTLLKKSITKAENQYMKQRVKKVLSERDRMDQKHKGMIQWLQKEIHEEVKRPTKNKSEEDRKNVRMKTLKIATDCYVALIREERVIAGVDDKKFQEELPQVYEFNIIGVDGEIISGDKGVSGLLPNQNPHSYDANQAAVSGSSEEVINFVTEANKRDTRMVQTGPKIEKVNITKPNTFPQKKGGDGQIQVN